MKQLQGLDIVHLRLNYFTSSKFEFFNAEFSCLSDFNRQPD